MFDKNGLSASHPIMQLLYLAFFVMLGGLLLSPAFEWLWSIVSGSDFSYLKDYQSLEASDLTRLQAFTSIAFFIIPGILYLMIYHPKKLGVLNPKSLNAKFILYGFLGIFLLIPLVYLSYSINQNITLPEAFTPFMEWIKETAALAEELLKKITSRKTTSALITNFIVLAALPAIGEELVFRGILQRILVNWTKHFHIAVWLTAFLFSLLHFQFLGFLPRMILGAFLGYLYFYSGNIITAMLAHFAFNGLSVYAAYVGQDEQLEGLGDQYNWMLYIVSFCLFTLVLVMIIKKYKTWNTEQKGSTVNEFISEHFEKKTDAADWVEVYLCDQQYQAELAKTVLEQNDIESVIINRKDSAYQNFGTLAVYVLEGSKNTAEALLTEAGLAD